ncbi:MAG TPA: transposase, partial [Allocoleopsis sp.]
YMSKRNVELKAGYYYHIYNRGNNYQDIYLHRDNYVYFLQQFKKYLIPETLDVIAYCLMPNHYHFLIYLKTDFLSEKMQKFVLSYTKSINIRYKRVGGLFQGRYKNIIVDTDEYLLHLSRYIHLNPWQANLVKKAEDWEFSSYREYLGMRPGKIPKTEVILSYFKNESSNVYESYRKFVESYQEKDKKMIEKLTFD